MKAKFYQDWLGNWVTNLNIQLKLYFECLPGEESVVEKDKEVEDKVNEILTDAVYKINDFLGVRFKGSYGGAYLQCPEDNKKNNKSNNGIVDDAR